MSGEGGVWRASRERHESGIFRFLKGEDSIHGIEVVEAERTKRGVELREWEHTIRGFSQYTTIAAAEGGESRRFAMTSFPIFCSPQGCEADMGAVERGNESTIKAYVFGALII